MPNLLKSAAVKIRKWKMGNGTGISSGSDAFWRTCGLLQSKLETPKTQSLLLESRKEASRRRRVQQGSVVYLGHKLV